MESQAILHLSDLSSSRWSWRRHEDAADDFDVWCGSEAETEDADPAVRMMDRLLVFRIVCGDGLRRH